MPAICIANNKGGVGKTTTAVNLAAGLARLNQRVLVIDLDGQANATYALTGRVHPVPSIYDVLVGTRQLDTVLWQTNEENVWIVPADGRMQHADVELAARPGREFRLARALSGLDYDYIIIDTPPSLGVLTQNALAAAAGRRVAQDALIRPVRLLQIDVLGDACLQQPPLELLLQQAPRLARGRRIFIERGEDAENLQVRQI